MTGSERSRAKRPPTDAALSLRPTAGAGVTAAVVVGALPAALLGLDLAWIVVSLGLSVLIVSALLPRRAVRALELVEHPVSMTPTAGRALPIALEFEALRTARGISAAVLDANARAREGDGAARIELGSIPPGARITATALGRFSARGRRDTFAVRLMSGYPFGLFEAHRVLVVPASVTVGPRALGHTDERLARLVRGLGEHDARELRARPRGSRRDLADGQRIARVPPPAREIAWAPTLRLGRTVVHVRDAEPSPELVDVVLVRGVRGAERAGLLQGDAAFEGAVRTAAWILGELARSGQRARLALSDHDPDAPPEEHAARAGRRYAGPTALREQLALVERATRPGRPVTQSPPRASDAGTTLVILAAAPLALRSAERLGFRHAAGTAIVLVGPDGRTWTSTVGPASARDRAHACAGKP